MEETRMTKLKKMTAVLLSVIMLVCCFSVQAGAASIYDKAVKLKPMDLVSGDFSGVTEYYYKIVVSDSGKIRLHVGDYSGHPGQSPEVSIVDSNGKMIVEPDVFVNRKDKDYKLQKKGTYYLIIHKPYSVHEFKDFYYTFEPDHTLTISLALNVKVGDELDFSALASNYTGKVTYKTTDSKVATVDKGKVTCKKAGKAKIRAYMNNGDYAEITLVVKKK